MELLGLYNHWVAIILMMLGLYVVIDSTNLVKKIVGLNVVQVAVIYFYVSLGKVEDGAAPILTEGVERYSNPLPQVMMLTAIVVGLATTSLALALVVRIKRAYGTVDEHAIGAEDHE